MHYQYYNSNKNCFEPSYFQDRPSLKNPINQTQYHRQKMKEMLPTKEILISLVAHLQPLYNSTTRYLQILRIFYVIKPAAYRLYKNQKNCERFQCTLLGSPSDYRWIQISGLIRGSFMVFGLKWTTHAPHATA